MNRLLIAALLIASAMHTNTIMAEEEQKTVIEDAGRVHITWQAYDTYRDIKPVNQSRGNFQRSVFKEFDRHFEKLANDLPQDHILKLTITDVDLAGMVFPNTVPIPIRGGFINMGQTGMDIRVMEAIHFPRLQFDYQLLDESGNTLLTDTVNLKDMGFMDRSTTRTQTRAFVYEKHMISRWYRETIAPEYAQELVHN